MLPWIKSKSRRGLPLRWFIFMTAIGGWALAGLLFMVKETSLSANFSTEEPFYLLKSSSGGIQAPPGGFLPNIFKRFPVISPTPTPTSSSGVLLISEAYYDPSGSEPEGEWVELFNAGGAALDLSGYKLGDEESIGEQEGMYQFSAGIIISPGEVLVVAHQAVQFAANYGFNPDFELEDTDPTVMNMSKYLPWAGGEINLSNQGDELLLLNPADAIVDAVSWGGSTWAFDPACSVVLEGYSLERFPPAADSNSARDWRPQPDPSPGIVDLTPPHTSTVTPSLTATQTPKPFEGLLLISEVVYDPLTQEPAGEWIEIYNPGMTVINLAGFKLGDAEFQGSLEGMLRFPLGANIGQDEALVIAGRANAFFLSYGFYPDFEMVDSVWSVPDLIDDPDWSSGSVQLGNTGDEVLLLDNGNFIIDAVSWGASSWAFDPPVEDVDPGHSIERYPPEADQNSALDWRDQANPAPGMVDLTPPTSTLTATPTSTSTSTATLTPSPTSTRTLQPTPPVGRLLISEVLYDPSGSEPANEWIELYNAGGAEIDLSTYKIGDEETQGGNEGMMRFPAGVIIQSGEVIVIANQATVFSDTFGFLPDFEMNESNIQVPNMIPYYPWAIGNINLVNASPHDEVLILDPNDIFVDAVSYGFSNWAFDPPAPDVLEGSSLERRPADQDSDSALDWQEQSSPDPGVVDLTNPRHSKSKKD